MIRKLFEQLARQRARRRVALACAAAAAATLLFGADYWLTRHHALTSARDRARGEAVRAASVIDAELRRFETVVRGVADDFDSGRVERAGLEARLRGAVDATPQMSGLGAAFAPSAWNPERRLYAPYFRRKGDGVELVQLDSLYDYTQSKAEWYRKAMREGPSWSEPAVGAAEGAAAVEYAAPFHLKGASAGPSGVVHGTMSLAEIDGLVSSLDLGEFGYSFLVSTGGFLISHPFAERYAAPERRALAARLFAGEALDPVTGEPCWLFTEPVPSAGWTVGVVFFKEISDQSRTLQRAQIRFATALVVTLCLLLAFLLEPYRRSHDVHTLWAGSVLGSLILAFGIAWLWTVAFKGAGTSFAGGSALVDRASVRRFTLDATRRSLRRSGELPVFVPTGVFIQTIEIISPNNVSMTGYIWQKYGKDAPKTVARGFVLPDAVERSVSEAYRRFDGETETVGWYVKAVLRQDFDYSGYPLDEQDFRLRLWHADLDSGVVLVPDLDSYRIIHPLARAGLENDFKLPGWTIERTQFASRLRDRPSSFGIGRGGGAGTELSFDVLIRRRILEPIFSNLLPLAVSGFMVFALLLMIKEATRSNIIQTLAAFSALFFVVILSQLDVRRRVSGADILYIEYFYFVMYGAMLAGALITLTNGWPGHFPKIEQREHLFPKLLFWPITLACLAVITICAFY